MVNGESSTGKKRMGKEEKFVKEKEGEKDHNDAGDRAIAYYNST